jgi:hypothetical protein
VRRLSIHSGTPPLALRRPVRSGTPVAKSSCPPANGRRPGRYAGLDTFICTFAEADLLVGEPGEAERVGQGGGRGDGVGEDADTVPVLAGGAGEIDDLRVAVALPDAGDGEPAGGRGDPDGRVLEPSLPGGVGGGGQHAGGVAVAGRGQVDLDGPGEVERGGDAGGGVDAGFEDVDALVGVAEQDAPGGWGDGLQERPLLRVGVLELVADDDAVPAGVVVADLRDGQQRAGRWQELAVGQPGRGARDPAVGRADDGQRLRVPVVRAEVVDHTAGEAVKCSHLQPLAVGADDRAGPVEDLGDGSAGER